MPNQPPPMPDLLLQLNLLPKESAQPDESPDDLLAPNLLLIYDYPTPWSAMSFVDGSRMSPATVRSSDSESLGSGLREGVVASDGEVVTGDGRWR